MTSRVRPVAGMLYGRLTLIRAVGRDKRGNTLWYCACDCGGVALTRSFMLTSGRTKSCGCWHRDRVSGEKVARYTVTEKKCSGCGEVKPAALFGKKIQHADGLKSRCRHCSNVEYKRRNKGAINAAHAARKAAVKQATPSWTDKFAIKEIYDDAARLTDQGVPHHVDHIIPIKGENVCGLHVAWNLRPLPARENCAKRNSLIVTAEKLAGKAGEVA